MREIGKDCWICIMLFLDYQSLEGLKSIKYFRNDVDKVLQKRRTVIGNCILHFMSGKKKRKELLNKYFSELYRFKPFVVQLILDNSSSYRVYNDKRKFINYVLMIAKRHEIDLSDEQFEELELVMTCEKDIYSRIRDVLKKLDIRLLMYLR